MGRELRVIDPEWKCQSSGDCCRSLPAIVMTTQEADLLKGEAEARALTEHPVKLTFYPVPEQPEMVAMQAGPCPFVGVALDGRSTCTVYSVRPYNCRRFGCMRPKPDEELFEVGERGCLNLLERLETSRPARRLATLMQRKAQKWARKHGWKG